MQFARFTRCRVLAYGGMIVAAGLLAAASPVMAAEPQQMAQAPAGTAGTTGAAGSAAAPPLPAAAPSPTAAPVLTVPAKPGKSGRLDKKACRAEIASLCAKTAGSRTKCLIANQSKLGPACAAAVAATVQVREVAKAACVADAKKFCGSAKGDARTQCLEANKAQLSPECLARVEKKELKAAAQKAATPPKQ